MPSERALTVFRFMRYSPKSFIKDYRDGALPGEEFIEKGRDLDEGVEEAKLLVEYGYDALDTDVGCMIPGGGAIRLCIRKRASTDLMPNL